MTEKELKEAWDMAYKLSRERTLKEVFEEIEQMEHGICNKCGSVECATCWLDIKKFKEQEKLKEVEK